MSHEYNAQTEKCLKANYMWQIKNKFKHMKQILILLFCLPLFVTAQKGSYKIHKVAPKESFTSIGRMFNVNGRELANFNHLEYEKGLSIGQEIKVPITSNSTVPTEVIAESVKKESVVKPSPKSTGSGTPIYHTVGKKETLYHISTLYNKVPIADLKKWNNLSSDGLSEGSRIIVGYTNTGEKLRSQKSTPVIEKEIVQEKNVEETPTHVITEPIKKESVKKEEIPNPLATVHAKNNKDGGFFKSLFATQTKSSEYLNQTGSAGIFKSTSGWDDGKYYCLQNSAAAGSIAKITSTLTGKTVYAKVLDVIPDIKQNEGLVLRLSNAAAAELGVSENTFDCTIIYIK